MDTGKTIQQVVLEWLDVYMEKIIINFQLRAHTKICDGLELKMKTKTIKLEK